MTNTALSWESQLAAWLASDPQRLDALFAGTVTLNRRRSRPEAFRQRLNDKAWLRTWPQLRVVRELL